MHNLLIVKVVQGLNCLQSNVFVYILVEGAFCLIDEFSEGRPHPFKHVEIRISKVLYVDASLQYLLCLFLPTSYNLHTNLLL